MWRTQFRRVGEHLARSSLTARCAGCIALLLGLYLFTTAHLSLVERVGLSEVLSVHETVVRPGTGWQYGPQPVVEMSAHGYKYAVRPLRSIHQHSNRTWQADPNEAQGYYIQSLVWLQVAEGFRPYKHSKTLKAQCLFADSSDGADSDPQIVDGHVRSYAGDPSDRGQGHSFSFFVDCQLPPHLQNSWEQVTDVKLNVDMTLGNFTMDARQDSNYEQPALISAPMVFTASNIPLTISPPLEEFSRVAICLSPLDYRRGNVPVSRLLEWRLSMADIGVERVNWYARDQVIGQLVAEYKSFAGGRDIFRHVPYLVDHPWRDSESSFRYATYSDQDTWYQECVMANVQSSEWIIVLDTDEFLMMDWTRAESPREQFQAFLDGLPSNIGAYSQQALEMRASSGRPDLSDDHLLQESYDRYKRGKAPKVIYRANTILSMSQHAPQVFFPMSELAKEQAGFNISKNHFYKTIWQGPAEPDAWPKLLHYRWGGKPSTHPGDYDFELWKTPQFEEHLATTREKVARLSKTLSHINS